MRTAKELVTQSIQRGSRGIEEFYQEIQDEAIAHGMTLAAEMHMKRPPSEHWECNRDILTARDNKVWRKE